MPGELAAEVLAFVRDRGPTHPRELEERFGKERAVNGWGGFSKATTRALQSLQYHGLLRVHGRRDGIRIYEAATPFAELAVAGGAAAATGDAGRAHPGADERGRAGIDLRPAGARRTRVGGMARHGGGAGCLGRAGKRRGRWRALSVAGRRCGTARCAGPRAAACPIRSHRLGAPALRACVGLGVSLRGLHQARATSVPAITRCRCCGATIS